MLDSARLRTPQDPRTRASSLRREPPSARTGVAERFADGDPRAFSEIYDEFSAPMFSTALHLLGSRELAAEAVQQAFLQAWRASGRFRPDAPLGPWLYAIVRRTSIDAWRRDRRHLDNVALDESADAADPLVVSLLTPDAWEIFEVRRAVQALLPLEREVVVLAHRDHLTHAEIASRLDVPVGTVKSRLNRAYRRLRSLLSHLAEVEYD
jgi:RNA polymerase sigma-70 factor (ECF subfamily)